MAKLAAIVFCTLLVSAFAAIPVFPNDWSDMEQDEMVINQGGTVSPDQSQVCCAAQSPGCKVQTQFSVGPTYVDVTGNRTRSDQAGASNTIISDYTLQMEMSVDLATMTCQEFCPMQGATLSPYQIDPSAVNIGAKIVQGRSCTGWQWKDTILNSIVMQINTIFVDDETGFPVYENDQLTPFGQAIGFESTTYLKFTPGRPAASLFAVKGTSNCPQSQNCGQNQNQNKEALQKMRLRSRFGRKFDNWNMLREQVPQEQQPELLA
jgi:hypothetical protein